MINCSVWSRHRYCRHKPGNCFGNCRCDNVFFCYWVMWTTALETDVTINITGDFTKNVTSKIIYWWFTRYPLLTQSSCYFVPATSLVLQSTPSLRWTMSPESERWIWIMSEIHRNFWQLFPCSMLLICWCNHIYFSTLVITITIIIIITITSSSTYH